MNSICFNWWYVCFALFFGFVFKFYSNFWLINFNNSRTRNNRLSHRWHPIHLAVIAAAAVDYCCCYCFGNAVAADAAVDIDFLHVLNSYWCRTIWVRPLESCFSFHWFVIWSRQRLRIVTRIRLMLMQPSRSSSSSLLALQIYTISFVGIIFMIFLLRNFFIYDKNVKYKTGFVFHIFVVGGQSWAHVCALFLDGSHCTLLLLCCCVFLRYLNYISFASLLSATISCAVASTAAAVAIARTACLAVGCCTGFRHLHTFPYAQFHNLLIINEIITLYFYHSMLYCRLRDFNNFDKFPQSKNFSTICRCWRETIFWLFFFPTLSISLSLNFIGRTVAQLIDWNFFSSFSCEVLACNMIVVTAGNKTDFVSSRERRAATDKKIGTN